MRAFEFTYPSKLIFGPGKRFSFAEELKAFGAKKVLIHYGGGSIVRSGLLDRIHELLQEAEIEYIDFGGVKPNPRLSLIREGIALCRKENIDFILACGGGSVIDSSKAIAVGAKNEEDIWTLIEAFAQVKEALPIGVIVTMPATASETGSAFVISNEETQQKVLSACPAVIPKFAILDPELYLSIPPKTYGPAICDMMSHVIERYFSPEPHTELTDGICEAVLRNIIHNGQRLLNGENTVEIWSELAVSANVAHNSMCGIGRLPDWSCHMIEHELSAFYDVPHGAGLTVLTPAWMKYVYEENIPLFAQFAIQVMGVEPNTRNMKEIAEEGIRRLVRLYKAFHMPTTMSELGIPDDSRYEEIAKRAVYFDMMPDYRLGYMKPLSWEDIVKILQLAS